MKFGFNPFLCAPDKIGAEKYADLKALGFDYVEPSLEAIDRLPEDEFEALVKTVKSSGLPLESGVEPFPKGTSFTATNSDLDLANKITERVFTKAARLGMKSFVYGGICRPYDKDVLLKKAWDHSVVMLKNMADIAAPLGIRILVEPVKRAVICNTIMESIIMVEEAKHPAVHGILVDYFHMDMQNEDMLKIVEAKDYILEAHISRPKIRSFPKIDEFDAFEPFVYALCKVPQNESITVEALTEDLIPDSQAALSALRQWFA